MDTQNNNQLCTPVKPILKSSVLKSNGRTYYHYKFSTYTHQLFLLLHKLFYDSVPPLNSIEFSGGTDSNKKKILDVMLIPFIDGPAIAAWLADDGYSSACPLNSIEFSGHAENSIEFSGHAENSIEFCGHAENSIEFCGHAESKW